MPKVTFNNEKRIFFNTLNERVERYFKDRNLKKTGNPKLYLKSIILLAVTAGSYVALLTAHLHPAIAAMLCGVFGIAQAGVGFNVMHDANHGSFSQKKWINRTMGLTANMMGINTWLWKQKHNIIHHTYTNINGVDIDIDQGPLLRMCEAQKRLKVHRYQFIYCIPLYALTSLVMIFVSEFINYFRQKMKGIPLQKMETREHIIFWAGKILYIFFFLILPIILLGVVPVLIGFLIMHIALGLTMALVFQLAHVVEATHFKDAHEPAMRIEEEWAIHQVQTTADFATENKLISWFTGGLNFQVEHHLFPKISHVHYPVIHTFVKEACQKFSIGLNEYHSAFGALLSHLRFMKRLGM